MNTEQLRQATTFRIQNNEKGCLYKNEFTNEMFIVLITTMGMDRFNDAYKYGEYNVKMKVIFVGKQNKLNVYQFVCWSN